MADTKVLTTSLLVLGAVAITSLLCGYNHGVFESCKSAILIIAGYAIGKTAEQKAEG